MRIRQQLVFCIIVLLILFLSACDQNSQAPVIPSPSLAATFAPLVIADSSSSSTPSAGAPEPSTAYEPDPPHNANDITIMILTDYLWADAYKSSVNKLMKYLQKVNWNIRFSLETVTTIEDDMAVVAYLQEKLASGDRMQDAYIVNDGEGDKLSTEGFLMDLTKKLPEMAPAYYSRYRALFEGNIYAIPTCIVNQQGSNQLAFLCIDNGENTNADYQNISDVLTLLEKDAVRSKKIIYWFADEDLVNTWAFEQGYYPLADYGMDGGVFADYNDKNCMPVLLEDIPGFADFALRCRSLLSSHQLISPFVPSGATIDISKDIGKEELLGLIGPIDSRTDSFPIENNKSKTTAYPVSAGRPRFPDGKPDYEQEIVIPSNSSKAADVMRFVEWAYLNSQNYDLVNYGEMGVDYQLVGDRYVPLINGTKATPGQWNTAYVNSVGIRNPFFNYQYARYPANAPLNFEIVKDKYQDRLPPIWAIDRFHKRKDYTPAVLDLYRDFNFSILIKSRTSLLDGLFDPTSTDSVSVTLTKLSELNNALMLENYVKLIKSLSGGG